MIELILYLLAFHFIGDFAFQSEWLGLNKGRSYELMFYHCCIYTLTIYLGIDMYSYIHNYTIELNTLLYLLIIIFSTHFIIDNMKARFKTINRIWIDQLFHILVLIISVILLGI
jgi:hypothetical protein